MALPNHIYKGENNPQSTNPFSKTLPFCKFPSIIVTKIKKSLGISTNEGFGLFTHSDGTKYEGQYFNDKPIGVHEVSFANGTTAMAMGNRGINGLNWTILNSQEVQALKK